jgi:LPXTG-motif cell wall-anchored protein
MKGGFVMRKKSILLSLMTLLSFIVLPLLGVADTKDKVTGAFIPIELLNPDTARSINLVQIKGGSGNLDTESLVDGQTNTFQNGWSVNTTGVATYTVKKIILNAGQTEPSLTVPNYTLSAGFDVTTSGGEGSVDLGTPNNHNPAVPAGFYTDHFDGTNDPGGPDAKASPDGFYLVEETSDSTGHQKYLGIISVPYMVEDKTGASNQAEIIYDVHIYPKLIPSLGFGFHLYVNILDDNGVNDRFASRATTPGEFDYDHWLHDAVFNGSKNTWTLGMDISHETLDQLKGDADAGSGNVWRFGGGINKGYADNMTGELASYKLRTLGVQPAQYDNNITNTRNNKFYVGVILTDLNTGERKYFQIVAGTGTITQGTLNGKTLKWGAIVNNTTYTFGDNSPGDTTGIIIREDLKSQFVDFFGTGNPFGGDYAGLDLLDPASGYSVMLTYSNQITTNGTHFNPEYLSSDLGSPLPPVRPLIYGFYALNGGQTGNYLTTFGKDTSAQNGFTNGDDKGQADGYGEFGVIRERAYITTGALNAIKVSEEDEPLGNAQFVIKIKANADGVTGFPGQSGAIDTALAPNQFLTVTTSTGAIGTTTTQASATVFTASTVSATLGKLQALGLDPDVDYQLVEVSAPSGYQLLKQPLNIPGTNISETTWDVDQTDEDLIKIINLPTVILPVTGGTGLWIVLFVGALLLFVGVLVKRRRTQTTNHA